LILTGVQSWWDTNPSNASGFLDVRGWPASGPSRRSEPRSGCPYSERLAAKDYPTKHHAAVERAKAAVMAEFLRPRMNHALPSRNENGPASNYNFANDSRASGCFRRALNLRVAGYDLHHWSDCDPRLGWPVPEQRRFEWAGHEASPHPMRALGAVSKTDFADRPQQVWAAMRSPSRQAARNGPGKTGTAKNAPRFGPGELGLAKRSPLAGHSVAVCIPGQSRPHLGARRDVHREASGRAALQFRLRSILRKTAKLRAEAGNLIQAREFEPFQGTLRTGHQVLKRRLGAAHEWPPMSDSHVLTDG
jgi:hypothetical protein